MDIIKQHSASSQVQKLILQAVHQSAAVLGLGLIGMAEDLGTAMAHRTLEHLLQYGDSAVRYLSFCCAAPDLLLFCCSIADLLLSYARSPAVLCQTSCFLAVLC